MTTAAWLAIGSCALAGLASTPHCAVMCGPLAGLASCGKTTSAVRYHSGRLAAYMLIGTVAGTLGAVTNIMSSSWASAGVSWLLATVLGVTAYRLWRPAGDKAKAALVPLRTGPRPEPSLMARVTEKLPKDGLFYGLATGFLPCGALYAAVALAAAGGSPLAGSLAMAAFATTSVLGLLAAAWVVSRFRGTQKRAWVRVAAAFLAVGAVVLFVRPIPTLAGDEEAKPACCTGE